MYPCTICGLEVDGNEALCDSCIDQLQDYHDFPDWGPYEEREEDQYRDFPSSLYMPSLEEDNAYFEQRWYELSRHDSFQRQLMAELRPLIELEANLHFELEQAIQPAYRSCLTKGKYAHAVRLARVIRNDHHELALIQAAIHQLAEAADLPQSWISHPGEPVYQEA